jgi:hypothetical protein
MVADAQYAYRLLDHLRPDQLAAVVLLMETMVPPEDRDRLNAAENRAAGAVEAWLKTQPPMVDEEALAKFNLLMGDLEEMGR